MKKNLARFVSVASGFIFLGTYQVALASLKDDIGYTQLNSLLGGLAPDGTGVIITQVEAASSGHWMPDSTNTQLSGKTINNLSAASPTGVSGHATGMATRFSGTSSSVSSGVNQIGVYEVNSWLGGDFLNLTASSKPKVQSGRIANHSWIGDAGTYNSETLRRVDWLIETDEFLNIVGTNNSTSAANQAMLSSAFNVISVGKTVGGSMGSVAVDSVYNAGRTVPQIVAPTSTTSAATAIVTSVAALLIDAAHSNSSLSHGSKTNRAGDTLYQAEYACVLKALIMAGADRSTSNSSPTANITDYRLDPDNQSANGLDKRYGAGQVNVLNSYNILHAGEQDSQEDGNASNISPEGFDYDDAFGGSQGTNDVANYQFTTVSNASELKASLVWNIDIAGGNFTFNDTATLRNMDLILIDVTTGSTVALSTSTIDNTENIVHTLEAGHQYKIQVNRVGSNFNWNYALAWQVTPLADFDNDGIPDNTDPDIDNDGIDNDWENLYGLDPYNTVDAALDGDNDTRSNLTEFLDGGNPTLADTGDATGDGQVLLDDLLLIQKHLLGITTIDAAAISRSDQNTNSALELADLLILQKQLAGN